MNSWMRGIRKSSCVVIALFFLEIVDVTVLLQTPTYIQMSEKQWTFQMDPGVRTPIVKLTLVTLKVAVSVI